MTDLLARLKSVVLSGNGWTARCPTHDDQHNSLSIDHRDGRWLVKCHAGAACKPSRMHSVSRLLDLSTG